MTEHINKTAFSANCVYVSDIRYSLFCSSHFLWKTHTHTMTGPCCYSGFFFFLIIIPVGSQVERSAAITPRHRTQVQALVFSWAHGSLVALISSRFVLASPTFPLSVKFGPAIVNKFAHPCSRITECHIIYFVVGLIGNYIFTLLFSFWMSWLILMYKQWYTNATASNECWTLTKCGSMSELWLMNKTHIYTWVQIWKPLVAYFYYFIIA